MSDKLDKKAREALTAILDNATLYDWERDIINTWADTQERRIKDLTDAVEKTQEHLERAMDIIRKPRVLGGFLLGDAPWETHW